MVDPGGRGYRIEHIAAALELSLEPRALFGEAVLTIAPARSPLALLELDADEALQLESVRAAGVELPFTRGEGTIRIQLGAVDCGKREIALRYRALPSGALRFGAHEVVTSFTTPRWLPCDFHPGDKATLSLSLAIPAGWRVAASGDEPLPPEQLQARGLARHRFELREPQACYLYGFAAGDYWAAAQPSREARADGTGKVELQLLATQRTPREAERLLGPLSQALSFFTAQAGMPYPWRRYTTVLSEAGLQQELAGLAALGDGYARELLDEPREDWLLVHELAHSWWGNSVTCASWGEFWLNEAFGTLEANLYKQQAWGREEYDREVVLERERWARQRAKGKERPLQLPAVSTVEQVGGSIPYSKGALALHLLREELGPGPFDAAVRAFVRAHAGGSVRSEDLEEALLSAAPEGAALVREVFARLVRGSGVPELRLHATASASTLLLRLEHLSGPAWDLPLRVAIQRDAQPSGRRQIVVLRPGGEARIALPGLSPASVRADDGGRWPIAIAQERPLAMLLWQLASEPDLAGRLDALAQLQAACPAGPGLALPAGCAPLAEALQRCARSDPARLLRVRCTEAQQPSAAPR